MNVTYVFWVLLKILFMEGALMVAPALIGFAYGQNASGLCYLFVALGAMALGAAAFFRQPKSKTTRAKEGLVIAGLAWLVISLVGAIPLCLTGEAGFADAFFEIVSGFTTTGASIFPRVESLCRATLFWRAFTHFIGGMGVLVFVMAILSFNDSQSMHIMRAEVPGHQAGKLVSKMKANSRILYLIYVALTAVEIAFLLFGGLDLFEAVIHAFSTAGTGGFSMYSDGIAHFNSAYVEWVVTVFMLLFSLNFNLFFFLLAGSLREVFKNEELRWFGAIVFVAGLTVTLTILPQTAGFWQALRHGFFCVAALISTTGFSGVDFGQFPDLAKGVLLAVMFIGACSGSTGGGIKVSRIAISTKAAFSQVRKQISPRSVQPVKFEGKLVDPAMQSGILTYVALYVVIFAVSFFFLCTDPFVDLGEGFAAVSACINNVGPGLGAVGPTGNYAGLSALSKLILCFDMLAGRLELYPMLALLTPSVWKRR